MEEQKPKVDKQQETVISPNEPIAALEETKDAEWVYKALQYIPDLTEAQRTTLKEAIVATADAKWADYALSNIHDLTDAQRSALQKTAQGA